MSNERKRRRTALGDFYQKCSKKGPYLTCATYDGLNASIRVWNASSRRPLARRRSRWEGKTAAFHTLAKTVGSDTLDISAITQRHRATVQSIMMSRTPAGNGHLLHATRNGTVADVGMNRRT